MCALFLFDSDKKKQNKGYLTQLVKVALVDGVLAESEKKILYSLGHKLGFVNEEIESIINHPTHTPYHPPYQLSEKIEQVYEVIKVVLADGVIMKQQKHMAHCIAIASGFSDDESEKVVDMVIKGVQAGKDEEEILAEYKKSLR